MLLVFGLSTVAGVLIGIGVMAVLALMFGVGIYNSLVTLRNRYKNAFSQIDVQLKRRYDLIPNLIEVAKGYMAHERETLEAVIQARNQAVVAQQKAATSPGDPAAMSSLNAAETQVSGVLGRLFALAESYPDLKANQNMLALQEELSSTENKVACAPGIQRRRDELQHTARDFSGLRDRRDGGIRSGPTLRDRDAQGARSAPRVVLIACGGQTTRCLQTRGAEDQVSERYPDRRRAPGAIEVDYAWTTSRAKTLRGRRPGC